MKTFPNENELFLCLLSAVADVYKALNMVLCFGNQSIPSLTTPKRRQLFTIFYVSLLLGLFSNDSIVMCISISIRSSREPNDFNIELFVFYQSSFIFHLIIFSYEVVIIRIFLQ